MNGIALLRAQRGLMVWLAPRLGISQPALSRWERVPAERAIDIEEITGIPRHLLRPDLWTPPWLAEAEKRILRKRIKSSEIPSAAA